MNLRERFGRSRHILAALALLPFLATAATAMDTPSSCRWSVKPVAGSSTCNQSTWCGGAGGSSGSITIPAGPAAVTWTSGGAGSPPGFMTCCLSETLVPPHDKVEAGNSKIRVDGLVHGLLITRSCTSPYSFLLFTFGSWSCAEVSNKVFGTYRLLSEVPCE